MQMRPICMGCTHLRSGLSCDAYPARIPDEIIMSQVDHREPFQGDHGILFDPKTKDDADYADELFEEGGTDHASHHQ